MNGSDLDFLIVLCIYCGIAISLVVIGALLSDEVRANIAAELHCRDKHK